MAVAKKAPAKKQTAKPAAKPAPAPVEATEESIFGVGDVAELISIRTGKTVKNRDLRTLLRKMARDGRLDREIVAGKAEKLAALKERKAEQRAAAKAAAAEESDDDEDLEEE
jgi:hypothetical protein